jgi:hypothetical protein
MKITELSACSVRLVIEVDHIMWWKGSDLGIFAEEIDRDQV